MSLLIYLCKVSFESGSFVGLPPYECVGGFTLSFGSDLP